SSPLPPLLPYTTLFRSPTSRHPWTMRSSNATNFCTREISATSLQEHGSLPRKPPWTKITTLSPCSGMVFPPVPDPRKAAPDGNRSEEHTSELQSRVDIV